MFILGGGDARIVLKNRKIRIIKGSLILTDIKDPF